MPALDEPRAIRLSPELREWIQAQAEKESRSFSNMVRRLLEEAHERREAEGLETLSYAATGTRNN